MKKTINTSTGYLYNDHKIKPLHKMLLKTSTYVKSYDRQTKWMYFLIINDDLLEKYNTIWAKGSDVIKNEFDSKSVCDKKIFENQNDGDEVTDFYGKKIPKLYSNHACWAVISLDSVFKKDGNYLQVF